MNDTGNKNRAVESECGPFHLSQLRGAQSIVFTKALHLWQEAKKRRGRLENALI